MVHSANKRLKIPSFAPAEYGLACHGRRIRLQDQKKKLAHDETFNRLRCFLLNVNDLHKYWPENVTQHERARPHPLRPLFP